MAKKQSRRSVSLSKLTYERLKSFCEANGQSMSQFVETRIGDFLGGPSTSRAAAPRATAPAQAAAAAAPPRSAPLQPPATIKSAPQPGATVRSAPNPGAKPAPAPSSKQAADEPAARRAAERIFTF